MGGKAIKNARRMTPAEHQQAFEAMCATMKALAPSLAFGKLLHYANKPDFGNLSFMVVRSAPDTEQLLRQHLASHVANGGVYENGDFLAIGVDGTQVDVTFVDPQHAMMFAAYHAYNGMGALIGKVAHGMGLALRQTGLFYREMDGTVPVDDFLLTDKWNEIMDLLGYDFWRWQAGFDDLEDMFAFVASSPNFRAELFHKDAAGASAERPTVAQLFSEWLRAAPNTASRNPLLRMLFAKVPGFQDRHALALAKHALEKERSARARKRFNGDLASAWTGRTGRELGALMRYIEETFGGKTGVQDWVLASSAEHIQETVMTLHTQLG